MPRGKTREELARIGKNTRFAAQTAAEMARRSHEVQREKKALKSVLEESIGNNRAVEGLQKAIDRGDMRALELYWKLTGQLNEQAQEKTDVPGEFIRRFLDKFHAKD